jgi:hypothetical protein
MTPEVARELRLLDELKAVVRDAIEEEFQNVEGGGKLWVAGVGIVTPDNPEVAALPNLAFHARGCVTEGVQRRLSLWFRQRK